MVERTAKLYSSVLFAVSQKLKKNFWTEKVAYSAHSKLCCDELYGEIRSELRIKRLKFHCFRGKATNLRRCPLQTFLDEVPLYAPLHKKSNVSHMSVRHYYELDFKIYSNYSRKMGKELVWAYIVVL